MICFLLFASVYTFVLRQTAHAAAHIIVHQLPIRWLSNTEVGTVPRQISVFPNFPVASFRNFGPLKILDFLHFRRKCPGCILVVWGSLGNTLSIEQP